MATKAEKEYRAQQITAAAQSLVGGRERAKGVGGGSIGGGPRVRAGGDLSRYNINYTDDPLAPKAKAKPKPKKSPGAPKKAKVQRRVPRQSATAPRRTTTQRTRTTAPNKALATKGRAGGTLYEGRGDPYTGLTIQQAKARAAAEIAARRRRAATTRAL